MARLTEKQRSWVDHYKSGHTAAEAARLAGYRAKSDKAFQNIGSENLGKLGSYVKDREKELQSPRIADVEEVNAFWSAIMRDAGERTADRLKASELRARAAGAFVDRVEHGGAGAVRIQIADMSLQEKLEVIERAARSFTENEGAGD